jgi:hypothetical protein
LTRQTAAGICTVDEGAVAQTPEPPAEKPQDLSDEFFAALGRMAAAWAGVEIAAHMNIEVIKSFFEVDSTKKEFPEQIGRKLEYTRKSYRKIDALSPYAEQAEKLIRQAEELSDERHFAIHGAAMAIQNETTAEFLRKRGRA